MRQLFLFFSVPEEHMDPMKDVMNQCVIVEGQFFSQTELGQNALLMRPDSFQGAKLYYQDPENHWCCLSSFSFPLNLFFTETQSEKKRENYRKLANLSNLSFQGIQQLYPFIAILPTTNGVAIYHFLTVGERGSLYVKYNFLEGKRCLLPQDIISSIQSSEHELERARSCFNHDCWYSKWNPEFEMERKYTFTEPVDTWKLILMLYDQICNRKFPGFIPEFNDEFQVWDYENYMFEVLSPNENKGYIAFIPQSDRLMTVKQKRFHEDSELRKEEIFSHVELTLDQLEQHAKSLCKGEVRALPPYRRKRFDVNLESLETGNVYGIFFDICRSIENRKQVLYQCEVEYLRSRTIGPLTFVVEEYEKICDLTKDFLLAQNCSFTEGYYSKLSFLRDSVSHLGNFE